MCFSTSSVVVAQDAKHPRGCDSVLQQLKLFVNAGCMRINVCLAVFAVRGESTRAGSLFSLWVTCRCLRNTLQKVPKVDATQLGTIVYRSA